MGFNFDELDWEIEAVGPQDEAVCVEGNVTEEQRVALPERVDIGLTRAELGYCGVVAVENEDAVGGKHRLHGLGLGRSDADGYKALPVSAADGLTKTEIVEAAGGELKSIKRRGWGDKSVTDCAGRGDQWDGVRRRNRRRDSLLRGRQQIFDAERERSHDTIHGFQAEAALVVKKIRDVRLLKSRLPGEGRGSEEPAIDPANEFQTQPLAQLRNVHQVEVAKKLYTPGDALCLKASA